MRELLSIPSLKRGWSALCLLVCLGVMTASSQLWSEEAKAPEGPFKVTIDGKDAAYKAGTTRAKVADPVAPDAEVVIEPADAKVFVKFADEFTDLVELEGKDGKFKLADGDKKPLAGGTGFELVIDGGSKKAEIVFGTIAPPAVNSGDNAWLLTSAALVLMMTAPGLALFYGGLVRRKNVLSTMMHSVFLMGLVSVLWYVYGYSMAFGSPMGGESAPGVPKSLLGSIIGDPMQFFMLKDVGQEPNADYAATIPHQTFMIFQLMFAIITPALISGAFAERVKFSAMVLFTILWSTFLYFPLAHMVWGKGGMFNWFFAAKIPSLDFAGGTVVHISAGISALVFCLVLGKRKGYPEKPMPPHSMVLSVVGAALLWVGWFGFNAGSALGAGGGATAAFISTHFAAATAALAWAGMEWITRGKPSALGVISGLVAGLVAITPAAGFVTAGSGIVIGLAAGVVCFLAVTKLKIALGYDDSLDAFGVHGVGGTLGAILTGVFASKAVNPAIEGTYKVADKAVSLEGGSGQIVNQAMAAGTTIIASIVMTFIILKIVDVVVGLRVKEEDELQGLDISQHGEEGYGPEFDGSPVGAGMASAHSHTASPVGAPVKA